MKKVFSRSGAAARRLRCVVAPLRERSHLTFLRLAVVAFARLYQRDVDRLVREDRTFTRILRDRRLQEILIVTVRKFGFEMRATRLVSIQRAKRDHAPARACWRDGARAAAPSWPKDSNH